MLIFEFYIVSRSMLVYMHMYDFKCRIMTGNTNQARMTQKERKSHWRTRTPRTVLILGGNDVMSLLYAPKHFAILNIIVWGLLGEELKCQGATQRNLKVRWKFNNTKGPTNTCVTRTKAKGSEKGVWQKTLWYKSYHKDKEKIKTQALLN